MEIGKQMMQNASPKNAADNSVIERGLKRQIIRYRNSSEIWQGAYMKMNVETCKLAVAGVLKKKEASKHLVFLFFGFFFLTCKSI
jgi:hypothetical protein